MFNPLWLLISIALCIAQSDHLYSNQIVIKVLGGPQKARELAKRYDYEYMGQVVWLEPQIIKRRVKRDFTDDDDDNCHLPFPTFRPNTPSFGISRNINRVIPQTKQQYMFQDPLYAQQWYLHRGVHSLFDMNVEPVGKRNYTGRGIVVSILDDGLQTNHPDLRENYDPRASLDINGKDADPTPTDNGNNKHGTRCAGIVAAVAGNGYCGVGIAYNSRIGGVRMLDGIVHDSVEATALSLNPQHIQIYSASWGPDDDGKTVDGPGPLAKKALKDGTKYGRNGLGSIYVWAAGSGGKNEDSCSCDGYTSSIYTLSISSASQNGSKPWYLEECPSTMATTYSSDPCTKPGIITTDLYTPGNGWQPCTTQHSATAVSAPLAAGIVALVLEANPSLTWRDVQYLMLLTARPEALLDENWVVNGVGRKVSTKFGYGLMDADKMVQFAEKWSTVPEQHICHTTNITQSMELKNGYLAVEVSTDGCQSNSNSVVFLEHVQAVLSIKAARRGALVVKITSPMQTTSVMLHERGLDRSSEGFTQWPFMSVHSWSEDPRGTWKIEVLDTSIKSSSVPNSILLSWSLVLHGTDKDPIPRATKEMLDADDNRNIYPAPSAVTESPKPKLVQLSSHDHLDEECEPGLYFDHRLLACRYCDADCATCSGPTSKECLSCKPRKFLFGKCLDKCPDGFTPENGTLARGALLKETSGYDKQDKVLSSSSVYILTATISCTAIIIIVIVVFCYLRARKYEKAPSHPVDADDKEADEEAETLSHHRLSDAPGNA